MSQSENANDADALMDRLRRRAADPIARTEYVPSVFEETMRSMSVGRMLSFGRSLGQSLRRVVASNKAGQLPDPDVMETAERLQREMERPAPRGPLQPASTAQIKESEVALGRPLPPFLARLYLEIGNGGFGPRRGLISLERLVRETRELRGGEALPRGRTWPAALLPLADRDPGWFCIDADDGRIIEWDPEDLEERSSAERFRRSFAEVSPSLEAWLGGWIRKMDARDRKPSAEERWARMAARAQSPEGMARQEARTRRYLEQLSPEDRQRWGLDELYPEIGDGDALPDAGADR